MTGQCLLTFKRSKPWNCLKDKGGNLTGAKTLKEGKISVKSQLPKVIFLLDFWRWDYTGLK